MYQIQIGMDEALAIERAGALSSYETFKEKFKPKKTTDDCYTPAEIYDTVADWVAREYQVDRESFVRPFWPGGDYQAETYPDGFVVVDNPPFSIMAEILRFYLARGVRFFLFAPALTLFSGRNLDVTYLAAGCDITYANGAEVKTSFITNMDSCRVRTCPDLYRAVDAMNKQLQKADKAELPKYDYPDYVITAAMVQRWTRYGIEFRVPKRECVQIGGLDAQRKTGKSIFGSGFLLSKRAAAERAAAERAAAERAAAHRWTLSEREQRIVAELADGEPAGRRMDPERNARIISGAGHADEKMRVDF